MAQKETKQRNDKGGYLFLLLAGTLWGTTGIFVNQLKAYGIDSSWMGSIKLFAGGLMLFAFVIATRGVKALKLDRKALGICLAIGFFCQGLFNICYLGAIQRVGMAFGGVLLYLSPVIVAILSTLFFREKMTGLKILALVCNLLGCALTVTGGDLSGLSLPLLGILMGFGAAFFYALAPLLGRLAVDNMDPYVTAAYASLFGSLTTLGFIFLTGKGVPETLFTGAAPFWLFGISFVPTALAYLCYYTGLGYRLESSRVGVITSIELVVATLIGVLAYHDPLGAVNMAGVGLVVLSIFVMNLGGGKTE